MMKGRTRAIIIETLPSIHCKELHAPSRYGATHTIDLSLKLPQTRITAVKVTCDSATFYYRPMHRNEIGNTQVFRLLPQRTGYGVRHMFECCGRRVMRLYFVRGEMHCRFCSGAINLSQTTNKEGRQAIALSQLESLMGSSNYGRYRKLRQRLAKRAGIALIAKPLR